MKKRSHVLRLFLIVCFGCLAAGPVAGEQKEKPVVDPKAAELLDKMTVAYRKLKALEVAGEVSTNFDLGERKNQKKYAFSGSFAAPNLFRHESKAGSRQGSTGEKVYAYLSETNTYYATTEALRPERFVDLFKPAATMLFVSNPSILMAASEEPMAALKGLSVKRLDDVTIEGKPYPALQVSGHATAELTFVVDPETHMLRRAIFDSRKQFTLAGAPEPKSAETIIDYTATKIDGEPEREQFAWSPPEGAVDAMRSARAPREKAAAELQGKPAPAFTLKNLNDEGVTLADLKGHVVVLDFWATWCGPCVASLPALDEFAKKHAAAGVKVFAVNIEEEKDRVAEFAKDRKLSLAVLLDTDGKIGKAYNAVAIPQTVIIGKDGNVRKVFVGADEKGLEREVEAAMKAE